MANVEWLFRALLCIAPVLAAPPKDAVQDLLAKAKEKARAAEPDAAAGLFGDALALVQKQGDLVVEQDVFKDFLEFQERLPASPMEGGKEVSSVAGSSRAALAAVMARLDAKRCGGLVSAPCIAGELLFLAVEKGDSTYVKEAAAALAPHAKGKSGLGLATLAKFAAALQETASGGTAPTDDAALSAVFTTAVEESWTDLALAAGLERAARCAARPGQEAAATGAVSQLAALVKPTLDPRLATWLRMAADRRLSAAPEAVRKPLADAFAAPGDGKSVSAGGRGGRGGEGQSAGARGSPVGEILRKGAKGSPLGVAVRTKEGFEFRVHWDPKFKGVHQRQDGVKHLDDGGLTLAFCDWSVNLRMVDSEGTAGQPGESSHPEAGRAFYRIARGESWTVRSDGTVTVGR